jgi:hypothetical protein
LNLRPCIVVRKQGRAQTPNAKRRTLGERAACIIDAAKKNRLADIDGMPLPRRMKASTTARSQTTNACTRQWRPPNSKSRVSLDAGQQLLVSVSVPVLASLAATPDMAGQLLTQVIQGLQLIGMAFTRNSLL